MEETTPPPGQDKCMICGSPLIETGYRNKMCSDCRTKQSRLAIPTWVKLFATAILVLIVIDLPKLPKFFHARIHYARGIKAQENNKYETAANEYNQVATLFPDFTENNFRLIVCCEHNYDFDGVSEAYKRADGKQSEELDLVDEANQSIDIMGQYFPNNDLDTLLKKIRPLPDIIYMDSLIAYSLRISDNVAKLTLANRYFDMKNYQSSDSLINVLLPTGSQHLGVLSLKAAIKREEHEYDSAFYYYDKMLERNPELLAALDGKARVELKMKHDGEADKYATEAYFLDSTNTFSLEAMAMVRYFENRKPESEHLLASMKMWHPEDSAVSARIADVIEGKTIYR